MTIGILTPTLPYPKASARKGTKVLVVPKKKERKKITIRGFNHIAEVSTNVQCNAEHI